MIKTLTALALAVFFGAGIASAQTVTVDLVGDPDSRWYEYVSDSFAQLDGGPSFPGSPVRDAFYVISSLPAFVVGPGGGDVVFDSGATMDDIATITFDTAGITGTGVEVATITDLTMSWNANVGDDDAVVGGYTEAYANETGTVTLTNGAVTSIDLTADVTFTYDFTGFGIGPLDFNGTITMTGTSFVLDVDQSYTFGATTVRYQWDVTGSSSGDAVIPEAVPLLPWTAQLALMGLLLGAVVFAAQRARA